MRHNSTHNHTGSKNNHYPTVAGALGATETVVMGEELNSNGANFPSGSADTVARGTVTSREDFSWDRVGCHVRPFGGCQCLLHL